MYAQEFCKSGLHCPLTLAIGRKLCLGCAFPTTNFSKVVSIDSTTWRFFWANLIASEEKDSALDLANVGGRLGSEIPNASASRLLPPKSKGKMGINQLDGIAERLDAEAR